MLRKTLYIKPLLCFGFLFASCFVFAQIEDETIEKEPVPFYISVKAGYGHLNQNGGSAAFPYFSEKNNGFASFQLRYEVLNNLGIEFSAAHHFMGLDATKAAEAILYNDSNAQEVSLESGTIEISRLTLGIFKRLAFSERFGVTLSPRMGISMLHSPNIQATVTTEPIMEVHYKSATDTAFLFEGDASFYYVLSNLLQLELGLGYAKTTHRPTVIIDSTNKIDDLWEYNLWTVHLGVTYRLF
ncbi:MAG TPA: hypothetical protein VFD80_03605 [Flavobacteriaceae bacterium]|nr:hypothetical protein [Flavobacteriaceae bacterium]